MANIFIIDGPDRSGKGTLIKQLKELTGAGDWKDSSLRFEEVTGMKPGNFGLSAYTSLSIFEELLGVDYIVDRGIFSMYSYGKMRGNKEDMEMVKRIDEDFSNSDNKNGNNNHIMNVIILPNIESAKKRCIEKKEDKFDDIARENYEILWKGYEECYKFSKMNTVLLQFLEDGIVGIYRKGKILETISKGKDEDTDLFFKRIAMKLLFL